MIWRLCRLSSATITLSLPPTPCKVSFELFLAATLPTYSCQLSKTSPSYRAASVWTQLRQSYYLHDMAGFRLRHWINGPNRFRQVRKFILNEPPDELFSEDRVPHPAFQGCGFRVHTPQTDPSSYSPLEVGPCWGRALFFNVNT
jgi:hypothetical protein